MKEHGLIYTVFFTFVVCFVFVFVLSLTNNATAAQVELNQTLSRQRAILRAMDIEFLSDDEVENIFVDIEGQLVGDGIVYTTIRNGEQVVAVPFNGAGLWGSINGVLALNGDGSRIVGLELIAHNETPGLGARIDESWYKRQFSGELIPPSGTVTMASRRGVGDPDSENGEVDGVTGATRTSEAMMIIINNEIERIRNIINTIGETS